MHRTRRRSQFGQVSCDAYLKRSAAMNALPQAPNSHLRARSEDGRHRIRRMITKMWMICLVIGIIIPMQILSQQNRANFAVDYSCFQARGGDAYVEVYYSVDRGGLNFQKGLDGFQAGALIQTYLKQDSKGMMIDSLVISDVVKSIAEISPNQKFVEQSTMVLSPGNYELVCRFTDLVSKQSFLIAESLKIRAGSEQELRLSDIQLANSIQKVMDLPAGLQEQSKFDKNGLRVVPNASRIYGAGLEQLSFYAEAYNMKFGGEAANSRYHAVYRIIDQHGKVVKEITGRSRPKPGTSCIIHGAMDVTDIPSGFYRFKIAVADEFSNQVSEAEKDFQVFRTSDFVAKTSARESRQFAPVIEDEFRDMSEPAVNEYFEKIKYISLKEEQSIFKKLDLAGKREFLKNFWKSRDPIPATPINERKEEYFRLLEYANANFSVGNKPGWKTDQGRVLLVYGQPDEVERFPSDSDTKAYQIWHYYSIEGGVIFVFVDIMSIRDFRLVHSTHRNEVQELEWKDRYLRY